MKKKELRSRNLNLVREIDRVSQELIELFLDAHERGLHADECIIKYKLRLP